MTDSIPPFTRAEALFGLASRLYPIQRSLTGHGVRATHEILREWVPELRTVEVPSGTKVFDWEVPDEWNIRDAYIADADGRRVVDFQANNLHVVAYSVPVDLRLSLEELDKHLHSLPDQPEAIPYVTSYYEPRWGFCLSEKARRALKPGMYRVVIDSTRAPGSLSYGEAVLPGAEPEEVLLSTYTCHPSMANDNVSGMCVTAALGRWLRSLPNRRYTYRILFAPETIGSITYLSRHLEHLRKHLVAGFVLTCVGDPGPLSYLASRSGSTLADRIARHVLGHMEPGYRKYTYLDRGSDERQFCSPGVDLPVALILRTKFRVYPEYHTSLDDLKLVTGEGLAGAFEAHRRCLEGLEINRNYRTTTLCEPQMGRRGLFPTLSIKGSAMLARHTMNFLAMCDGTVDLIEVADRIGVSIWECARILETLSKAGLVEVCDPTSSGSRRG